MDLGICGGRQGWGCVGECSVLNPVPSGYRGTPVTPFTDMEGYGSPLSLRCSTIYFYSAFYLFSSSSLFSVSFPSLTPFVLSLPVSICLSLSLSLSLFVSLSLSLFISVSASLFISVSVSLADDGTAFWTWI